MVRIRIVEGRLAAIEVTGNRWFREAYFRDRLWHAADAPVSVNRLERALRLLQRNRYVERLDARLEPGARLGESVLRLQVEERAALGPAGRGHERVLARRSARSGAASRRASATCSATRTSSTRAST